MWPACRFGYARGPRALNCLVCYARSILTFSDISDLNPTSDSEQLCIREVRTTSNCTLAYSQAYHAVALGNLKLTELP